MNALIQSISVFNFFKLKQGKNLDKVSRFMFQNLDHDRVHKHKHQKQV